MYYTTEYRQHSLKYTYPPTSRIALITCRKRGNCGSKYVREENITEEIAKALQKVSLPDRLAQEVIKRAQALAVQEKSRSGASSQIFQQKLRVCDSKIDRLLDLSLDGVITSEEYSDKKRKLIEEKTAIKEKLKDLGGRGTVWLEPLVSLISQAKSKPKISSSPDLIEKAIFFKKVGLNRKLHHYAIHYEPREAWYTLYSSPFLRALRARRDSPSASADTNFPESLSGRNRTYITGSASPRSIR